MKKTEKVSIGRYAFTFDESAYEIVNNYLNELEIYYLPQDGGEEIMEGIEERIAELLRERFSTDNVISEKNIKEIINIIGRPETIEEESGSNNTKKDDNRFRYNSKRHLYRDLSNKIIGGVCSGLASYFNIDVSLVRIIFLFLFLTGFITCFVFIVFPIAIIYLALWAIIPAAKTARQRWEMRGENGSLNDICRNIENGTREMGDMAEKICVSDAGRAIGRAFAIILGVVLLLISISGLTSIGLFAFSTRFASHILWEIDGFDPSILYCYPLNLPLFKIALLSTIFLPFLGMLYGSVMLLFNLRSPKWKPGLIIFIIWLIALVSLIVMSIMAALDGNSCISIFDSHMFINIFD
jgi:phage shock protein PspC (stress-responsive transcriptional regulator)